MSGWQFGPLRPRARDRISFAQARCRKTYIDSTGPAVNPSRSCGYGV